MELAARGDRELRGRTGITCPDMTMRANGADGNGACNQRHTTSGEVRGWIAVYLPKPGRANQISGDVVAGGC